MQQFGTFRVEEELAPAPAGPVFRARHYESGEWVRVYTLMDGADSHIARQFHRRRQAASVLEAHGRFARLLAHGREDGVDYFALQEPEGETLPKRVGEVVSGARTIVREPGLPVPRGRRMRAPSAWVARSWMLDLGAVVDHAHRHGLVIGNLSPEQVWIGSDGSARLADPGDPDPVESLSVRARRDPASVLSTAFLAPEQWMGRCGGPWSDVYALGAILWWLLGGLLPVDRYADAARLGRFLPLPPLPEGTEPTLVTLCQRAIQSHPRERFPTAALFRAALQANDPGTAATPERHARRGTLIRGLEPESPGGSSWIRWTRWMIPRTR